MDDYNYINEKFTGVSTINDNMLISQLENNMKSFLDWGFVNIGGFINVIKPEANLYDNTPYQLIVVEDPNYTNGQIWQSTRKDWIWESGIVHNGYSPVSISGVVINGTNYALDNTTYKYYVDYNLSRIVFNSAIPTNSALSMNYSYRWVQVYKFDDANWWQEIQYNTDANKLHFENMNAGDFTMFSMNRIQLPAIIIETVPRSMSRPYRLGDKSLIVEQDLLLHVLAANRAERNNLIDIIRIQQDKVIWAYDTNKVVNNEVFPLSFNGSLNPNRKQYSELIRDVNYQWKTCMLQNIVISEVESFSQALSEATIRLTAEIIFDDL